ncbi:MAG: hypothetical protein H8E44_41875 [Planctomycetes bacterium]|nr:hypothetical protein [Planctomycetota bacterium]MBL7038757.1 hypothetical protein [Pirellulaceae bacterium]
MVRFVAVLLVVVSSASAAPPARFGRIDVYSVDGAFDVRDVRANPGAQILDVGWRGEGMADTGATAQARARETWREVWIEVVPERDGKLQINFQGEYYRKQSDDDVRLVWVDQIQFSGAEVVNADLEDLQGNGVPRGWRFSGAVSPEALSRDGSVAASGRVCMAVWHGAQLRQTVDVRAGQPVRVTAKFRAVGPEEESPETARHKARFAGLLELQSQTITVKLATPEDAQLAKIRPLPLYDGAEWAVTSRWDDNTWTNLKTRAVLLEHGHRGTFFLNDPKRNFYGNDYGLLTERSVNEMGKVLTSGGTTIGGHSLTHPMMSYQNRNRMFEEVLGCRIALEAAFDNLVNAYAFSFCNYRNSIEGAGVQRDIAMVLARAGYLQVANHRFAEDGCWPWAVAGLLPPDGRPIDRAFSGFLADEDLYNDNPAVTYSMHSWYDTPEEWSGFEADLDRYGNRPEWWYCNQNEYGAYRAQYRAAARGKVEVEGTILRYHFQRPSLLDLNDPIPLTFEIAGVEPDSVKSIECSSARIDQAEAQDGKIQFHVGHPAELSLPVQIDHVATAIGELAASTEFPAFRGAFKRDGKTLTLRLENAGTPPIVIRRVAYRVPLRYSHGIIRRPGTALTTETPFSDRVELQEEREDSRYRAGDQFFAAQVDFRHNGETGRVYFTTRETCSLADASYPQQGFVVLGPVPRAEIDLETRNLKALLDQGWTDSDGQKLKFIPIDPKIARSLSAEVIPVRGRWDNHGLSACIYLLRSRVHSPDERQVRFLRSISTVPAVWINGNSAGDTCSLQVGDNELLIAYEPPVNQRFSPEHAGPMFRIVDAESRQRLDDIRYQP